MILPPGVAPEARLLLIGRALRSFADGYVAILLPAYLLALGFGQWEVGLISTTTLLGSALMTLAVGQWGHRHPQRRLLLAAACLMGLTGLLLAGLASFWPLLLVACLVALPLAGLVALVGSRARGRRLLAAGPKTLWVFCCLRGLHVELGDADGTFLIYLK